MTTPTPLKHGEKPIVLATRRSPLALKQAELACAFLSARLGRVCTLLPLTTTGDERRDWSLEKEGGKGLFTKELESALLEGRADAAVHSAKDLPADMVEGLALAAFLPRADARDVWVVSDRMEAGGMPKRIATGSPRRRAQLRRCFAGAEFCELRGNVHTRLEKIAGGFADGTVLAAAGLARLGIAEHFGLRFDILPLSTVVPAAGQGAIALQTRAQDAAFFAAHSDSATTFAVSLERALLARLGGGCQVAVGIHWENGKLWMFDESRGGLKRFDVPFGPLADIPEKLAACGL